MKRAAQIILGVIKDLFDLQFYIYTVGCLLLTWINPFLVDNGRFAIDIGSVVAMQFILLHSGVLMALSPFFLLVYLPMGLAFSFFSGNINIFISFLMIMFTRVVNSRFENFKGRMMAVSAVGGISFLFLGLIIVFVPIPWPVLGLTPDNLVAVSKIHHQGTAENLLKLFPFAVLYFTLLGLFELYLNHGGLERSDRR